MTQRNRKDTIITAADLKKHGNPHNLKLSAVQELAFSRAYSASIVLDLERAISIGRDSGLEFLKDGDHEWVKEMGTDFLKNAKNKRHAKA